MSIRCVLKGDNSYAGWVPKLWNETIEAHRREVREAILDTTAALVAEGGLRSATMKEIAERTGIGRATLYKYFRDVEAILVAWHERQVAAHLAHLTELRDQAGSPGERLEAVLCAYAVITHGTRGHHDTELTAFLHRDESVAHAHKRLRDLFGELIAAGARAGEVRDDVAPVELAAYCLHAIGAVSALPSEGSAQRLVAVVMAGLRPSAP
jgi:AcrR family transcriptional regulator